MNTIEVNNISKAFGSQIALDQVSFEVKPREIFGLLGPNGAGKTTLFRMIMGQMHPDLGSFEVGDTVKVAYVDQAHAAIDSKKSVYEVISGGVDEIMVGNRPVNSRAYAARFNFTGADQEKKCGVLSGGERNRLHPLHHTFGGQMHCKTF